MHDIELQSYFEKLINSFLMEKSSRTLIFETKNNNIDLQAFWNPTEACWDCNSSLIDPLSLFLLSKKPERNKKLCDDEMIATLAASLERRPGWFYSFQYGWFNLSNKSTSITGYLVGSNLRFKFLHI